MDQVRIVGGGLAGCEAAWQLADRGVRVRLIEMRPAHSTEAHKSDKLAEIVCSNSLKSTLPDTASGVLKTELDILGSRLLEVARSTSVPAGHALAVDRETFSATVTAALRDHPLVAVEEKRQDDLDLPLPALIATGPLTAEPLSSVLREHCSSEHLYFYDAIAPSVDAGTIDGSVGFRASRYNKGPADYLNVPLSKEQYGDLVRRIREADVIVPHAFEEERYFEACLPVEVMAARGQDTLRYGPLRPKGLMDPKTGREPYAVIQLRQETVSGNLLGIVGFQTRMTHGAQREVVRTIPGFAEARILRYGSIHRNIFLDLPRVCEPYQRDRRIRGLFYAGQICGVEGYVECIASGLVAALSIFAHLRASVFPVLPGTTMTGSLMTYIHTPSENFQPMNANMGLLPAADRVRGGRRTRYMESARRADSAMRDYRREHAWLFDTPNARPVSL
jgi:methylenetetrahydrofolate--tRNA-(uracil-5-)-methyltransferase